MKSQTLRIIVLAAFVCTGLITVKAQVPAVLDTGTIQEQLDYLQSKTNIYNNYRAVRNDMFLKLKSNVLESEKKSQNEISGLNNQLSASQSTVDSLSKNLAEKGAELEVAIKTKNSFSLFGLKIDKILYNTILWIIILALAGLAAITFLLYKRSLVSTNSCKKDLVDIKEEFEAYKKQAREKQEKLVVKHHQEMMKLKKGLST